MSAQIARALLKEYSQKHLLWCITAQDTIAPITKAVHAAIAKRIEYEEKDSYRR